MLKTRTPWLIFLLVAASQFMVVLDVSITNVALPAIQRDLGFTPAALQWVVTSYALTFGGFLLLGGRASDLFGHRKVLMIGLAGFTFISLLIGLSHSDTMLVVLRAIQGIFGALMSPAALSLVLITFPEGAARNKALGWWTTIATGGAAAGLLLGGVLTQYLGWEANFFVNVPLGIVLLWAIRTYMPKRDTDIERTSLDLPGAVLVTAGLTLFVYVVSMAPEWGWQSRATLQWGGLAIGLLAAFVINESRSTHPLMPLSIFRRRNLTGANIMTAPIMAGAFGMFFLISLYIQNVLEYSPLMSGLSFLPFPIIIGTLSPRIAPIVGRYGYKPFVIGGPLIAAASMAWLIRLPVDGNYWTDILPNVLLMPIGMAFTFMPLMVAATSGIPGKEAGLASGLISTSQQMGGALGLAILSSVAASVTAANMDLGEKAALVAGYDRAFLVGVLLVLGATLIGAFVIKEGPRKPVSKEAEALAHAG